MVDPEIIYQNVIALLDRSGGEYRLFSHRAALSYDELAEVQKETGFFGTEMKCMVLSADGTLCVYVTLQGNRVDMRAMQERMGAKKVRLASAEELREHFGAEPGCAYPFGFDAQYTIYVDPQIYSHEWLLFSPVLPTKTVQVRSETLRKVFGLLGNKVSLATDFNCV